MGAHPGQALPGEWLRHQRVAAGLTQEDLAELSGVSVRTIADLERGRTRKPYPSSLRALVRALGLPDAAGTDLVARYRIGQEEDPPDPGDDGPAHQPSRNVTAVPGVRSPASPAVAVAAGADPMTADPVPRQL